MHEPILYESHSHTPLCKHAHGEPEEYAEVALARGLKGLIITCHNPMPGGFSASVRMDPDQFGEYVAMVARAREAYAGRLDVCLGIEADYFEGYESWVENQLQTAEFHYVLGSVHPQIGEYRDRYHTDDPIAAQQIYFGLLAKSAETRLFDCIAHPDLIKNMVSEAWQPHIIMDDIRHALDRIAETGVAMELNTSGLYKRIEEMNPFPGMLVEMRKREIPVVLGADAHMPRRVADDYEIALDVLQDCGFTEINVFQHRKRRAIAIDDARASLMPLEPASAY